ncbi:hypothetical protein [Streptomyces sp. NPDC093568]|uniref:hypothetical protein n=1 Tax=Streptomyces sp. NPDC093568 TaxID=3366041 RepID=UPI003827FEE7
MTDLTANPEAVLINPDQVAAVCSIERLAQRVADIDVHHLPADGDHVVLHLRRLLPDGGPEIAVVDIRRIKDGLVAECWEIVEPVVRAAADLVWWEPAGR